MAVCRVKGGKGGRCSGAWRMQRIPWSKFLRRSLDPNQKFEITWETMPGTPGFHAARAISDHIESKIQYDRMKLLAK
jgi:hypothetical protein